MLTALDLIAGAGGATQGLKDAGYRVLAVVEEWSDAVRTFSANHPEVRVLEPDIRCVEPGALRTSLELSVGSLDLVTACPPCQSFSTLGKMDASDSRNDLIAEFDATPLVAGAVIDLAGPRESTNIRDMDTADQMAHVVAGMVGRRLPYRDLTADTGRSRVAS